GRRGLYLCRASQGHAGSWVWIGVGDVRALYRAYRDRGAIIRQAPKNEPWGLEMRIEDPDGNVLRFGSDAESGRDSEDEPALVSSAPPPPPLPIACDLDALSSEQRARERVLEELRAAFQDVRETPTGFTAVLPADPALLSRLGELVGLERLCCPFLTFDLSIPERRGPATLRVHGAPGSKPFLRSVFFAGKPSPDEL